MRPLALLLLLLTGCAPQVAGLGPPNGPPRLAEAAILTPDAARLPLRVWRPEGAPRFIVLALHGFNDHAGNFLVEGAPLLTAGGALVYAYDQRGFGRSPARGLWPGREALLADLDAAARLLAARHPGVPMFLMGESMGGAVALLAAARPDPPPVAGFILLAPALWPEDDMPWVMRRSLSLAAHTIPALAFRQGFGGVSASDNQAALRRFGQDPWTIKDTRVDAAYGVVGMMHDAAAAVPRCCAAPVLLLYGGRDRVVPNRAIRAAMAALPEDAPLRFALYPEGWHLLLRDGVREAVAADILAWMGAPAARLPSGAEAAGRDFLAQREVR